WNRCWHAPWPCDVCWISSPCGTTAGNDRQTDRQVRRVRADGCPSQRREGSDRVTVAPEGRKLLRVEARNSQVPIEKKPSWIKTRATMGPEYNELRSLVRREGLHTVCEEAGCPNIFECWEDIGRASCRERVEREGGTDSRKNKN